MYFLEMECANVDSVSVEKVDISIPVDKDEKNENEAPEMHVRRSNRDRRPPERLGEWVNICDAPSLGETQNVEDALNGPEKSLWKTAMRREISALSSNDVWDLTELPEGRTPVKSKWVFKKRKLDLMAHIPLTKLA
ncbi:uncharacterized protein LOC143038758 [Oratosquilla oratoria]|uniref:uncharacterized protein LOC143038758 n=1 Tax=Oratosquilla oratoria TaxID=337810 RepID=UPI003F76C6C0